MKIQKTCPGSFLSWVLSQAAFLACCLGMAIQPALGASHQPRKRKRNVQNLLPELSRYTWQRRWTGQQGVNTPSS